MRYAVITSFAAGACYNYFFLPPVGHFTISDPQNILALVVFLVTSIVASRMSNRIREESTEAHNRQAELEILYRLSRALLQTDELVELTNTIPTSVAMATGAGLFCSISWMGIVYTAPVETGLHSYQPAS